MRFIRNRAFEAEMSRTAAYRAGLRAHVETRVVPVVRRLAQAPWMPRGGNPIQVEQDGDTVQVINTDHAAHLKEYGSVNNPPTAPFRRGARAAGLHFDEQ